MVTRHALKNAIYSQVLCWSHETSGNNSKWSFMFLFLCLFCSVCFHSVSNIRLEPTPLIAEDICF